MAPNQTADMETEAIKLDWEEIEHLAFHIIKTFIFGARFDYDRTVNLSVISLFISQ